MGLAILWTEKGPRNFWRFVMAVPKRRVSNARQGNRRSHQHVKPKQITYCNRCGSESLPHTVCWNCGWSNSQNREVVAMQTEEE